MNQQPQLAACGLQGTGTGEQQLDLSACGFIRNSLPMPSMTLLRSLVLFFERP